MNRMRGAALLQGIMLVVALGFLAAFLEAPQEVARIQKAQQVASAAVPEARPAEKYSAKNTLSNTKAQLAASAVADIRTEDALAGEEGEVIEVELKGNSSQACADGAHTIVDSFKGDSSSKAKITVEVRSDPVHEGPATSVAGEVTWYTADGKLVTIQCEAVGIAIVQCKDKKGSTEKETCVGSILAQLLGGDPVQYSDIARGVMEGITKEAGLTTGILSAFAEDASEMLGSLKASIGAGDTAEELASLGARIKLTEESIAAARLMKELSDGARKSLEKALGAAKTLTAEVATKLESLKDKNTDWGNRDLSGGAYNGGTTFGGDTGAFSGGSGGLGGLGGLLQGVLGKLFGQGQSKSAEEEKKQAEQQKQKDDKNKICKEKYPGTSYVEKNNRCECPQGQDFVDNKCKKPEETKPPEGKVRAQISCAPSLQDAGFPVALAYACTNATEARADGFDLENEELSGSATPTVSSNGASSGPSAQVYALTCIKEGKTETASCSVGINYPFAVLVANPSEVQRGEKVNIGWITGGMDYANESCELREKTGSRADVPLFSKTGRSGVLTTPALERDVTALLRCTTRAGSIKETEIIVKVL